MKWRSSLLAALLVVTATPATADLFPTSRQGFETANRVVLRKSERRLYLYRDDQTLASYRVSLGLSPKGRKEREGDFRTPEGRYLLTRRNPDSDFFLAIQVSYPDAADIAAAKSAGVQPGGAIMIHGLPNQLKYPRERYLSTDWTNGCIALSNEDMLEVWLLTVPDTPIEILP